jgi:hypothetical protein
MAFCHEVMDCQGHGSSLMAAILSPHVTFPVTAYTHIHRTRAATSQRTSYFPQHYFQTFNGQAYRRLFATEVLDERPLSTAFWITLSGRHPVTDLYAWTKFYSASQLTGQDELLIWLGQSAQWLSETLTSRMQSCIQWTINVVHPHYK